MSATAAEPPSEAPSPLNRYLAAQMLRPRVVGLLLCGLCVGVTLWEQGRLDPYLVAALMLLNVVVWPVGARWHTLRADKPMYAESVNLWFDAVFGGFWVAAMQGSLVPAAVVVMCTALNTTAMGGPRFMLRGWLGQAIGLLAGVAVWGWQFQPIGGPLSVFGSLPALLVYPLLMGIFMHRLTQHLHAQRRELRFLSEHDALSGVHNRRFFDQTLRQVFNQFQRHERSLSLLVADVDDFKRINDGQGHAAGDAVIRRFGEALTRSARGGDVVARLGGDEFVVLLFDTGAEQAFHYARRVQAQMGEVSISFGVATARRSMKNHEHWLEQADTALYRSKAQDRGGVSLAGATDEAAG